jgi:hypothetical protein
MISSDTRLAEVDTQRETRRQTPRHGVVRRPVMASSRQAPVLIPMGSFAHLLRDSQRKWKTKTGRADIYDLNLAAMMNGGQAV